MSQDPGQRYQNNGTDFTASRHDTYAYIDPRQSNLNGKNVLITGASRGIGKATAISYAKAGASGIALAARSSLEGIVKEVKEAAASSGHPKPKVLNLEVDVTDRASVEASAKEVSEAFNGVLDVLINNAGYLSSFAGILDSNPDDWWRNYEVNVKGVYLVTRAFFPMLVKSTSKIVINITSIGALTLVPGTSAYGTSKLAILRFTEFVNQDHGEGKEGMVAIAVRPGGVMTELAANMPEAMHHLLVDTPQLAGDTLAWLGSERREWLGGRYVNAAWDMEELSGKDDIVKRDLLKVRMAVNTFPTQ